jgi:putative transposase
MPKPPQPLTALSEAQRTQTPTRFAILPPTLEKAVTQAQVAPNHDLPRSQVQPWIKNSPEKSLAELANAAHPDTGQPHNLPDQAVGLIQGLVDHSPPHLAASIHRQIVEIAAEQVRKPPNSARVHQIIKAPFPGSTHGTSNTCDTNPRTETWNLEQ